MPSLGSRHATSVDTMGIKLLDLETVTLHHTDPEVLKRHHEHVNASHYYSLGLRCHCSSVRLYLDNASVTTCYRDLIEQQIMNTPNGRCFYEILGVPPRAQKQEIKNAYRRLALRFHPDKNEGDLSAKELFQEVSNKHCH